MRSVNDLRFADDVAAISENEHDHKCCDLNGTTKFQEGLLNVEKTEVQMVAKTERI